MTDVVENQIGTETLEEYDRALRKGDKNWLNNFWRDVAEQTGYTKQEIINAILDEYNDGEIKKTAMDYYMSTLARWQPSSET